MSRTIKNLINERLNRTVDYQITEVDPDCLYSGLLCDCDRPAVPSPEIYAGSWCCPHCFRVFVPWRESAK